jgi:hypothetical protein
VVSALDWQLEGHGFESPLRSSVLHLISSVDLPLFSKMVPSDSPRAQDPGATDPQIFILGGKDNRGPSRPIMFIHRNTSESKISKFFRNPRNPVTKR